MLAFPCAFSLDEFEVKGADCVLALASIDFQISFSDLHEKVTFNVTEKDSETNSTDAENSTEREE